MQTAAKTNQNQERLDILLALALAFDKRRNQINAENSDNQIESALKLLSPLRETDLTLVRQKAAQYENFPEEEKQLWQARVLNRVTNQSSLLDKNVHDTQIAAALKSEPRYIQKFILRHLTPEISAEVAALLEMTEESNENSGENVNPHLQNLIRRKFLANFVSREALYEQKPLVLLSGEDLLILLQQMGQRELALVCRGIKEIENLAPFLRQFGDFDARAIVEQMAKLGAVEQRRIEQAEHLVKEAWQREIEPVLVTQFVGIWKLAGALALDDVLYIRYTKQKLPVNLAAKLQDRLDLIQNNLREADAETLELANIFESEVETTASKILLEQMQAHPNFEESDE